MTNRLITIISCLLMALAALLSAVFVMRPIAVRAYESPGKPTGYVTDFAQVISSDTKTALEADLKQFDDQSTNQIAVATINSLGGDTIENFANELFREWKVGTSKNNNGVLMLVAVQDREVRIEVGYGLEGALPDITANRIVDSAIVPAFRQDDYDKGIVDAVELIKQATRGEFIAPSEQVATSKINPVFGYFDLVPFVFVFFWIFVSALGRTKSIWAGGVAGLIVGVIGLFVISSIALKIALLIGAPLLLLGLDWFFSKFHKHFNSHGRGGGLGGFGGGGGSGGGFGGFGGGSSGGGGASGRW